MCGRFTLATDAETLAAHFELPALAAESVPPRFNIAPSQNAAVIRLTRSMDRKLDLIAWGLIPSWATDSAVGARLINARAETLASKPAFRHAFARRRCLVPTDGFFEWQRIEGGKQPYLIRMCTGEPFALAGLWERWRDGQGAVVDSFTIVTTPPSELLAPIHDRMPAIILPADYDRWLARDRTDVADLLRPRADIALQAIPVSTRVNNTAHDDDSCVTPIGPPLKINQGR